MSKIKLFISENNFEEQNKLKEFCDAHPEFEVMGVADDEMQQLLLLVEPKTKAAKVMGEFNAIQNRTLEKRISDIFITVGIPAHIKGYQFLREAIKLTIEQPGIINSITKQLYPTVAKRFNTSASKVERAIRHAIEVGWSRGKIENINNIFGVKVYGHNDRPTNGEFIALVADKMLIEGVG